MSIIYLLKHRRKAKKQAEPQSAFARALLANVVNHTLPNKAYAEAQKQAATLPFDSYIRFAEPVNQLLYRLAAHFAPATIAVRGGTNNVARVYLEQGAPNAHVIFTEAPPTQPNATQGSLTIYDARNALTDFTAMQPADVLILAHPYHTPLARGNWDRVKQNPAVTLTVDLFDFGLAVCRPGEVKEDLFVRV